MQTVTGVGSSLWVKKGAGLYAPARRRFPINGLVYYAPLWHKELQANPFISKDLNAHSCAVTGGTWGVKGWAADGDDKITVTSALTQLSATTQGTLMCNMSMADETPVDANILMSFGDTDAVTIIFLDISSSFPAGGLQAYCTKEGVVQWDLRTDNQVIMAPNTFYNVAVAHNGTQATLYVNGVAPAQTFLTDTVKASWFSACPGIDNGFLGVRSYNNAVTLYMSGVLMDVWAYNRGLSSTEINNIYLATKWRY